MSKGLSGLFSGTIGWLNSSAGKEFLALAAISSLISSRVVGLDTREHPIPYKIPSPKKLKELRQKRDNRIATREEYKLLKWTERFNTRRNQGVKDFWEQERERLTIGLPGTREWTAEQRQAILNGRKPKYNGKTIQGHHSYSASLYPHLSNSGNVIYPVTHREHLKGWHGGNYKKSKAGIPLKYIKDF